MDNQSGNLDVFSSIHEPYWIASTQKTDYPVLTEDVKVDVAIIGGGLVGITTAFLLKSKGLNVAVIEANRIANGTSGHTTAKITSQHGLIYSKLNQNFGEEKARQYALANETAIRLISELVKEKNIDCDFSRQSAYVYTQDDNYVSKIEDEANMACKLGIKAEYLDKIPLPFDVKGAVRFDDQAQFHPRKYILALAKDIPGDGSHIFENTKVTEVNEVNENSQCEVITLHDKKVIADKVVVASHFPCYEGLGMYFARMYQEKSYALGVTINDKYPGGMYITAEEPGRSIRSLSYEGGEMLIIGGEHHKAGSHKQTNVHYENLADFAKKSFNLNSILYRWSTQDCMTPDDAPYVGYLNSRTEKLFVATGFRKWGMTNSTAAAILLTDLITKGESPWAPVYSPSRFDVLAAGPNIVVQNLDVAANFIKGKLQNAAYSTEIKNGEAKVIEVDGERFGAYRDTEGKLHVVDITCTHLGCELVWNEAETTWDCPCHGSRFTIDGDNVETPAFAPLKKKGEGLNHIHPNLV